MGGHDQHRTKFDKPKAVDRDPGHSSGWSIQAMYLLTVVSEWSRILSITLRPIVIDRLTPRYGSADPRMAASCFPTY
jgi:hypothetical protein